MNYSEVRTRLRHIIGYRWLEFLEPDIRLGDREIAPVSPGQMMADMADYGASHEYTENDHDCEDETFEELGHMTTKVRKGRGFAWTRLHAFCVFLHPNSELWIYDRGLMGEYWSMVKEYGDIYRLKGLRLKPPKYWRQGRFFKRDLLVI